MFQRVIGASVVGVLALLASTQPSAQGGQVGRFARSVAFVNVNAIPMDSDSGTSSGVVSTA